MSLQDTYQDCKDLIATNLITMGVTSVTGEDGLTTLANAILDVPSGGGGGTITLTSNKTEVIAYNNETCTITANYSEGTGATIGLYINGTKIGNMTDNLDGTYSYTYTATGKGDLSINAKISNTISNTLLLTDYLRNGLTNNETWHNIYNSSGYITVTDGVAVGKNKLTDYSWDNSKDWIFECDFKVNNTLWTGLLFIDVTNTNQDSNSFGICQVSNATNLTLFGNPNWATVSTSVGSRDYVNVKIIKEGTGLTFYLNNTVVTAHETPNITDICVGLYSWTTGEGSFKNMKIKYLSDTNCPALEEVIDDAIVYINGTGV